MAASLPTKLTLICSISALLLAGMTLAQSCNTNQNPYCAGNAQFEKLCCTYPSICYWSNRNGDPACCPAGSDCRGDGGPAPTFTSPSVVTAVQATTYYVATTYSTTQPQQSTVTYYITTTPNSLTSSSTAQFTTLSTVTTPAVVVVTNTQPVTSTAPVQSPPGAFVTVTQVQVASGGITARDSHRSVYGMALSSAVLCTFLILIK